MLDYASVVIYIFFRTYISSSTQDLGTLTKDEKEKKRTLVTTSKVLRVTYIHVTNDPDMGQFAL